MLFSSASRNLAASRLLIVLSSMFIKRVKSNVFDFKCLLNIFLKVQLTLYCCSDISI